MGGAWRRFLQHAEIRGAAQAAARAPALVVLGKLQHLADRLRAVHRVLPVERQHLPDRPIKDGLAARHRRGRRAGLLRGLLAGLRRHLPAVRPWQARRRRRRRAGGGVHRGGLVAGLSLVRRPRRLPAGGRHDGHHHERQRVLLDHPRPAQERRRDEGRPAGGPRARPARQAAQRAQHLFHAAGGVRHDEQPLQRHLHPSAELAGAAADHAGRRGRAPVLRGAPPLQAGQRPQSAGLCAAGRRRAGPDADVDASRAAHRDPRRPFRAGPSAAATLAASVVPPAAAAPPPRISGGCRKWWNSAACCATARRCR